MRKPGLPRETGNDEVLPRRLQQATALALQQAFRQLESEMLGTLALIQCHLDVAALSLEVGDQQVIQRIQPPGSALDFASQTGEA